MKRLILIAALGLLFKGGGAQFIPEPLNFPGNNYFTDFNYAVDSNTVWVGTIFTDTAYESYSKAIKTTDGGQTWQFYTIPDTGSQIIISNVCALDSDKCFYTLYNGTGGAVWKTENGGSTWTKKTTTQFVGGWPNFYHAFSADTGIAGGDPNNGYWEIQRTTDGGNTWSRVPSANIPASFSGEYGTSSSYSASGNYIWFASGRGRCYRSINKGLNWIVRQVASTGNNYNVCFVDSLRGVFWQPYPVWKKSASAYNQFFRSTDGGLTWSPRSLDSNYRLRDFCSVPGTNGGLLISAYDMSRSGQLTVLYTTDFLNTYSVIDTELLSDGSLSFRSSTAGWLSGFGTMHLDIFKFRGNLNPFVGVRETSRSGLKVNVYPNPSSDKATLRVLATKNQSVMTLKVTDAEGRELEYRRITSGSNLIPLNAAKYENGIYIISLTLDSGESAVCRWVVCRG